MVRDKGEKASEKKLMQSERDSLLNNLNRAIHDLEEARDKSKAEDRPPTERKPDEGDDPVESQKSSKRVKAHK